MKVSTEDKFVSKKTASEFTFNFSGSSFNNVRKLAIKVASLRNNIYNVDVNSNKLSFTTESAPTVLNTVEITPAQYTTSTLIVELETQINLIITPSVLVITQDPVSEKLLFTVTGGEKIQLFSSTTEDDTLVPKLTTGINTLSRNIGIIDPSTIPLAINTIQGLPNLNGLDFIYIHSQELAANNLKDADGRDESVIDVVPLDSNFRTILYYQPADDDLNAIEYSRPIDITTGTITLKDQYGNLLSLHGSQVTIVFKLWLLQ